VDSCGLYLQCQLIRQTHQQPACQHWKTSTDRCTHHSLIIFNNYIDFHSLEREQSCQGEYKGPSPSVLCQYNISHSYMLNVSQSIVFPLIANASPRERALYSSIISQRRMFLLYIFVFFCSHFLLGRRARYYEPMELSSYTSGRRRRITSKIESTQFGHPPTLRAAHKSFKLTRIHNQILELIANSARCCTKRRLDC
jgi:hypothetical protein